MPTSIAVVGAGLVGALAAIGLAKQGYTVVLFELRDDPRVQVKSNLRSINLAVSSRGLDALSFVDESLSQRVVSKVIPMTGRMIHPIKGNEQSQKYGLYNEAINSIDRSYLNNLLLDELDKRNIEVKFGHKLTRLDLNDVQPKLYFENGNIERFDVIIGADGAFSKVRQGLEKYVRMDVQKEYIDCAYIELSIPPSSSETNLFKLDKNHLHIWPRDNFMLIALPNLDGSFTSTFFGPWSLVENLTTKTTILEFFKDNFPDAVSLIGEENLVDFLLKNPRGQLLSLTCSPYNYKGKCLLIGDAAHAMVPFYGQGMNCGFEDVHVLLKLLDMHEQNFENAFDEYSSTRHEDLVAIIDLAKENYKEMSHKVNSKLFLMRKKVDFVLSAVLKDRWLPLYTMVSFRSDIPYSEAIKKVARQEQILGWIQNSIFAVVSLGVFDVIRRLRR